VLVIALSVDGIGPLALLLGGNKDQHSESSGSDPSDLDALDVDTIFVSDVLGTLEEPENSQHEADDHQNEGHDEDDVRELKVKTTHNV